MPDRIPSAAAHRAVADHAVADAKPVQRDPLRDGPTHAFCNILHMPSLHVLAWRKQHAVRVFELAKDVCDHVAVTLA